MIKKVEIRTTRQEGRKRARKEERYVLDKKGERAEEGKNTKWRKVEKKRKRHKTRKKDR